MSEQQPVNGDGGDRRGGPDRRGDAERRTEADRRVSTDRRASADRRMSGDRRAEPERRASGDRRATGERRAVVDRRSGMDRRTGLERLKGAGRRRSDFTRSAEEGEMTDEQFLFVMAINTFKRVNARPFPTWTEVLEVIRRLGYRKTMPMDLRLEGTEDWTEPADAEF